MRKKVEKKVLDASPALTPSQPSIMTKEKLTEIIELLKVQSPVKYEMRKAELEAKLATLTD